MLQQLTLTFDCTCKVACLVMTPAAPIRRFPAVLEVPGLPQVSKCLFDAGFVRRVAAAVTQSSVSSTSPTKSPALYENAKFWELLKAFVTAKPGRCSPTLYEQLCARLALRHRRRACAGRMVLLLACCGTWNAPPASPRRSAYRSGPLSSACALGSMLLQNAGHSPEVARPAGVLSAAGVVGLLLQLRLFSCTGKAEPPLPHPGQGAAPGGATRQLLAKAAKWVLDSSASQVEDQFFCCLTNLALSTGTRLLWSGGRKPGPNPRPKASWCIGAQKAIMETLLAQVRLTDNYWPTYILYSSCKICMFVAAAVG